MKNYAFPFFLGFVSSIIVTAVTLSMSAWAPTVFKWMESSGSFQFKPWIFFAPAFVLLCIFALVFQRLANWPAFSALLAGGLFSVVVGAVVLLVFVQRFLPGPMRY